MKTYLFILIALIGIFLFAVTAHAASVCACGPVVPTPVCSDGEHIGNPHCDELSPTIFVEVTETPVSSPSGTVEVTQAVTPTTPPSPHGDNLSDGRESGKPNANTPLVPKAPPATGKGR